ncbi:MAG TPA: hypothetical protein VK514_00715 [Candidatus Acidoferrum sp.]|nr:hypothetical protein [Candidatus Acidoferrum sp.]
MVPERPIHARIHFCRLIWCLAVCFLCNSTLGQQKETLTGTVYSALEKREKIQVRGCLGHLLDQFHFASEALEGWVVLTGNTAGLERYVDRELTLEGSKGEAIRIEGYFDPIQSFKVSRIIKVFEKAEPELAVAFTERTAWRVETNKKYGVKFAHPESMSANAEPIPIPQSNFVTPKDSEIVSSFEIPSTTYTNANLRTGFFRIFVNRNVRSRGSCRQFGELEPSEQAASPYVVGKLQYVRAEGADLGMGSSIIHDYFHIFQNGLCYEVAFELNEYDAKNAVTGCNVPLLTAKDNWNLIKLLIESVSFFRPTVRRFPNSTAR